MSSPEHEVGGQFAYTSVDDMTKAPRPPHVPVTLEERVSGVEDAVSDLAEAVAKLIAIARRDHPDLTADWDDDGEG